MVVYSQFSRVHHKINSQKPGIHLYCIQLTLNVYDNYLEIALLSNQRKTMQQEKSEKYSIFIRF